MWQYNHSPTQTLQHNGVKGMRWGHRKKEEPSKNQHQKKPEEPSDETKGLKLTDKQKKAIKIGAIVAVSALAIYGGYKLGTHYGVDQTINTMRNNRKDDAVVRAMLKGVNPHHTTNPLDPKFSKANSNCGLTTIAGELNMRGEKCYARLHDGGMYPEQLGSYFKGMHSKSISSLDLGSFGDASTVKSAGLTVRGVKVEKKMAEHVMGNFPKGSRGSVYVPHIGGAHFISFENLGDRVRFDNPQYPDLNLLTWFNGVVTSGTSGSGWYGGIRFTRLDDLQINRDTISEVITTSKDDLGVAFETNVIKGANFVMNRI